IGEGVHEGEITKWLVQPGDTVSEDQPMVEVMTDKATVEIPSPVKGKVSEVFFKEGETVEVGKVIVKIEEGEASSEKKAEARKPSNGNGSAREEKVVSTSQDKNFTQPSSS